MRVFKFIWFVALLTIILLFLGFNLGSRVDVNLLFGKATQVPIGFICLASFVVGLIVSIPFFIGAAFTRMRNATRARRATKQALTLKKLEESVRDGEAKLKEATRGAPWRKDKKKKPATETEEIPNSIL